MACKVLAIALALACTTAALSASLVSAQSTSSCSSEIVGLAPCLNYISGNTTTPSSSCCSQLSSVVESAPQCLCLLLNGGASSFGVTINQTRALELPGACTVQTPPVSLCSAVSGAKSPSTSPATTATPATSTGGGSKATPSPQSSDATSHKWSSSVVLAVIFVAASASFMNP